MKTGASRTRFGLTAAVALGAIAVFATMGGTGLAGGLAKPAKKQYGPGQYQYSAKKVTICHNETVTLRISVNALKAHVTQHDDTVGPCEATAAAKAKAAKAAKAGAAAKAAKAVKAAKAAKAAKPKKKADDDDDTEAGDTSSATSGPGASQGKGNGNGKAKGNGKK
jgi:hypothetical protein